MYILRTLLSYSLPLLLVAALAAAWVYRDTLKPELNAAIEQIETRFGKVGDGTSVAQSEAPRGAKNDVPPSASVTQAANEPPTTTATANATPSRTETAEEPAAQTPTQAAPAVSAARPATTAENAGAEAPQAHLTESAPAPPLARAERLPATSSSAEPTPADEGAQANPGTAETQAQAGVPAASVEATLLDRARRAYWAGDLSAAIQAYQALLDRDPADPDVWGELGNVYYAQGRWREAGEAYYEAARRLQAKGEERRLGYLLRLIEGLAPEKAAELHADPAAAASSAGTASSSSP